MQVAVYQCRIRFYSGDNMECVTRGLAALSLLEPGLLSMLETPGNTAAYDSELLESIVEVSGELGIQKTFEKLEILQDKFLLAAHDLLTELIAPLAYAAPHLLHTLPLIGVLLTFKHGKCVQASFHVYPLLSQLTPSSQCSRSMYLIRIFRISTKSSLIPPLGYLLTHWKALEHPKCWPRECGQSLVRLAARQYLT